MAGDQVAISAEEIMDWVQRELHASREAEVRIQVEVEQLRRLVHDLTTRTEAAESAAKIVEPQLRPITFLPEKLQEIEREVEELRQVVGAAQSGLDSALRVLEAGAIAERNERAQLARNLAEAGTRMDRLSADVNQLQAAMRRTNEAVQGSVERHTNEEQTLEQVVLRLERALEVNRDAEQRLRDEFIGEKEERFEVVFERLQVVGEMVKRTSDVVEGLMAEQSLRDDVIEQIEVWRAEHNRIEGRIGALEATTEQFLQRLEDLAGGVSLVEGRHTGLADRVATIRTEINEILDQVREEFQKFNNLQATARKRQIDALSQEQRELKFHSLRPPDSQP